MITSYEFLLTPWFFENNCNLQTDLLCYLLACLASLCNLFCRHVHGLKATNWTILVMGINIILKWKWTFVQASRFVDVISDNDGKRVWKTFLFLQTCTTREYDWIKTLILTDVFRENRLKMDCLPFVHCSPPNRTLVNMTSFSHSYVRSYLEFSPPFNTLEHKWYNLFLSGAARLRFISHGLIHNRWDWPKTRPEEKERRARRSQKEPKTIERLKERSGQRWRWQMRLGYRVNARK